MMDDSIFADDIVETLNTDKSEGSWKILIVDDEEEVHRITKLNLQGFSYDRKALEFFSAYSAEEAINVLSSIDDMALMFLDVVMETKDAGLKCVKHIREELKKNNVRIILRTGQPGYAPEEKVILNYDINDYKEKHELTYEKLLTAVISSLRSYKDIKALEKVNKELSETNVALQNEMKERLIAQESVRESEAKFRKISEAAQDAIVLIDAEGNISYWNKAAENIFGYTKEEIIGRSLHSFVAPDKYANEYKKGFEHFQHTGDGNIIGKTVEYTALRKNGEEFPVEISVSSIQIKGQWNSIGVIRDITLRKNQYAKIEKANTIFEKFVPKEFLSLVKKREKVDIEDITLVDSTEETMSVLFADIRSFTSYSENMTPKETFQFINRYLETIIPSIEGHGGFIDNFLGDGVICLFKGNNVGVADDALNTAISMQKSIQKYNYYRQSSELPKLKIGIGIHCGSLILGIIGNKKRMEATVIGDTVNLASRIEELTKIYGISIAITSSTYSLLSYEKNYLIRKVDTVKIRGRDEPVAIYDVFDSESEETIKLLYETLDVYNEGLDLYSRRKWSKAFGIFNDLHKKINSDKVIKIYLDRCSSYMQTPPGDEWSCVTDCTCYGRT